MVWGTMCGLISTDKKHDFSIGRWLEFCLQLLASTEDHSSLSWVFCYPLFWAFLDPVNYTYRVTNVITIGCQGHFWYPYQFLALNSVTTSKHWETLENLSPTRMFFPTLTQSKFFWLLHNSSKSNPKYQTLQCDSLEIYEALTWRRHRNSSKSSGETMFGIFFCFAFQSDMKLFQTPVSWVMGAQYRLTYFICFMPLPHLKLFLWGPKFFR